MQMSAHDALWKIGEFAALAEVQPGWDESMAAMPPGVPHFLQADAIRLEREWAGLPPDCEPIIEKAAGIIAARPALLALAWHCHRRLVSDWRGGFDRWPRLQNEMGELAGVFYLIAAMSALPSVRALHCRMGVPESITRDTCLVVSSIAMNYRQETGGGLGVPRAHLGWCRHHVTGEIFRVGRMEYMIRPFRGLAVAYRSARTGRVIALAADGAWFDADGYVAFDSAQGVWQARLAIEGGKAVGMPISPRGMALRRTVSLDLADWRPVLAQDRLVLEMHIPEGGGMTLEKCGQSMRDAFRFYARFFPDKPAAAIASYSWIFNNQLESILPESANLVRYLRELYLFPVKSTGTDGFYFIFGVDKVDPATAPRRTSLQRAIADHLAAGKKWRRSGMFFLPDDMDRFGTQYYRSQWQCFEREQRC